MMPARQSTGPFRLVPYQVVLGGLTVTLAGLAYFRGLGPLGVPWVTTMGVVALGAVAYGVRTYRRQGTNPPSAGPIEPWWLLGAGLALIVLTSGAFAVHAPLWLELAAFGCYPPVVLGLLRLISGRMAGRDADTLVDAGLAATGFGLILWIMTTHPGAIGAHHHVAALVVRVLLPALDIGLVTLVSRLLLLPGEPVRACRYLGVAVILLTAAHLVSTLAAIGAWEAPSSTLRFLVVCTFGLWGLAALDPSMSNLFEPLRAEPPSFSPGHVIVVSGAMLIVPAIVAIEAERHLAVPATVAVLGALVSPVLAGYVASLLWNRACIERRAQHDDLTGLPNRSLFLDRLSRAVAHARRNDTTVGVLFIDLDRFKTVNDTYGHNAGDKLLLAVATRMQGTLREEDTVARLGGDEFAVLLAHVKDFDGIITVAEKLMSAFGAPFDLATEPAIVTPSIGVAVYPQDGDEPHELMASADTAMYRAKERGRNMYEIFSPSLRTIAHDRVALESALASGLERGELVLHYQPKVDFRTGRIVGAEALVRWNHPEMGLLYPGDFIPVAEQSGLVVALGEAVLRTACAQNKEWQRAGLPCIPVSVNVSARQFRAGIVDTAASALRQTGLDARWLEVELTESAAVESLELTTGAIEDLRNMGIACALDDFGTGYCSLKYLSELPITTLKIDKSFVQAVSPRDASIVSAIINLGHGLGLKIVAEGVETPEQFECLAQQGCDEVQGYLFSKPVPADVFAGLLTDGLALPRPAVLRSVKPLVPLEPASSSRAII